MTEPKLQAVILAAGKGTRMKSELPKVLHEMAGKSLLDHVLAAVRAAAVPRTVVVVGHQHERVEAAVAAPDLSFALQSPQLGTGHAVQVAVPHLDADGYTVILAGDVPLLLPETIRHLVRETVSAHAACSVLTCVVPDAGAYGRIVKDAAGGLQAIVEARDATPEQLAIGEYNTGVFCFRTVDMIDALAKLDTDNDQGEYYLTDTVAHLVRAGRPVQAVAIDDPDQVVGINTVDELKAAEALFLARG
ncbi:MAG TPA: NTP transferase domain-containing protein [Candidatus Krumholzibacteria bacterium]|nr:NTP transferase domain-containing protein [Candidatus Krumholzibacteria bacterium]HRX51668.1 NTP transferase domain-containing protein [Candidatus Krumholzibacteria bacterium]